MKLRLLCLVVAVTCLPVAGCSEDAATPVGTGGASTVGGAASGGQVTVAGGGQGTGGSPTGGLVGSGGFAGSTGGSVGSGGSAGSGGGVVPGAGAGAGGLAGSGGSGGSATGGVAGGSAGQSAGAGGSAVPATFATLKSVLMDTSTPHSCYGGLCHDFPENPYFQLKKDGVARTDDDLYTFVTTYMTKNCGPAINIANPPESGLVKLLKAACGATERMPLTKCFQDGDEGCVPPATIAAIQQWIAAGAPR